MSESVCYSHTQESRSLTLLYEHLQDLCVEIAQDVSTALGGEGEDEKTMKPSQINILENDPKIILVLCNSNWIEWSTIQGVIERVISKSDEREA